MLLVGVFGYIYPNIIKIIIQSINEYSATFNDI